MRIVISIIATVMAVAYGCITKQTDNSLHSSYHQLNSLVNPVDFETLVGGKQTALYTLYNSNGLQVKITNYGGRIVSVLVPDRDGVYEDVVLGYSTINEYLNDYTKQGAVVGRFANRIANAQFSIDGKQYMLTRNAGQHILHGGDKAFDSVVWDADFQDSILTLSHVSQHLNEGFPGNLEVTIRYLLTDDNELVMDWRAETDWPTHVNISNHSYFNLAGEGEGSIHGHELTVNADSITEPDSTLIPTGRLITVEDTPLDFRVPHSIGKRIDEDHPLLTLTNGYDYNYVINRVGDGLTFAAKLVHPPSGRTLVVYTTQPGIQLYTTNFMDPDLKGKKGKPFGVHGAVCLETQHFPDSPNQPNFPSTQLNPGMEYHEICVYRFVVE